MFSGLFLKERTLRVRKETNMLFVMVCLAEAGVLIQGNYRLDFEEDYTIFKFKSTDSQWKLIGISLDNMDEIMKGVDTSKLEEILKS